MRRKASLIQLTSTMWEKNPRLQIPLVSWKWKRKWRRRPVRMKWWRIEGREGGEGGGQALKRLPSAWEELSTMCKGWMSCKRAGRPKSRRLVSEEERKKANCLCLMFHMNVIYVSFSWWYIEKIFSWEALQIYIFDCLHDWSFDCTYGATVPATYILSGLVLETCTSELAVHVRLKIVLMDFMALDFVHEDLYMWSLCTSWTCTWDSQAHFQISFEMKIHEKLMKIWWKVDADLMQISNLHQMCIMVMHIWCTLDADLKSAPNLHQICIKSASIFHQFFIIFLANLFVLCFIHKYIPGLSNNFQNYINNHLDIIKDFIGMYSQCTPSTHKWFSEPYP